MSSRMAHCRKLWFTTNVCLALISWLLAVSFPASAWSFSARVLEIRVTDGSGTTNQIDDFEDGEFFPDSPSIHGTASESGGALELSSPGIPLVLPAPLVGELSQVDILAFPFGFGSDTTLSSIWSPSTLAIGDAFSMGLVVISDSIGAPRHLVFLGLANRTLEESQLLGGASGLSLSLRHVVLADDSTVLSETVESQSLVSAPTQEITFLMSHIGVNGSLNASVLLAGGASVISFAPIAVESSGVALALLSASNVVPEPATATLVGLGLALLSARSRSRSTIPTRA